MKTITPKHTEPRTTADEITPLVCSRVIGRAVGVHHRTIELQAQKNKLPHYRVGGRLRFDFREVMTFMKKEAAR